MQVYIHIDHNVTPYGQVAEAAIRTKERLIDWLANYNERNEPELKWAGIFEDVQGRTGATLTLHVFDLPERAMAFVMAEDQPIICTGD